MQFPLPARFATAGAATLLTAAVLAGCSDGESAVSVGEVSTQDVAETVDAPGTVVAVANATLTSPAEGTVARLAVTEGQQVNAGDVLLVVDSPDAEQRLAQAREADAAAIATPQVPALGLGDDQAAARAAAQESFDRAREQAHAITDPQLQQATLVAVDNAEAQYELSLATSDAAAEQLQAAVGAISDAVTAVSGAQRVQTQAALTAAQQTVDSLTVRAPIGGTVSLTAAEAGGTSADLSQAADLLEGSGLPADISGLLGGSGGGEVTGLLREGQPVTSGQPLLTVTDASALSVAAQVDETDIRLIEAGTVATVTLDAAQDEPVESQVASVDPQPATSARGGVAFTVRVPLPDTAPEGLRPGMSAIASLTAREAPDVPVVPASAVVRRDGGDSVWAVDDDGRASLRRVQLGVLGDGVVEVVSGVEDGERIVTAGADLVEEGQRVG